jgi:hypothetical protein
MAIALGLIALCVTVFLNVVATWMVRRSTRISWIQQVAPMVLIWLVPFVGAIFVIHIFTELDDRRRRPSKVAASYGGSAESYGYFSSHRDHLGGHSGDGGHHGHHEHGGDGAHGGDGGGH